MEVCVLFIVWISRAEFHLLVLSVGNSKISAESGQRKDPGSAEYHGEKEQKRGSHNGIN